MRRRLKLWIVIESVFSIFLAGAALAEQFRSLQTTFKAVCPPDAIVDEALSKSSAEEAEIISNRESVMPAEYHVFTTDLSFSEAKKYLQSQGITLTDWNEEKSLNELRIKAQKTKLSFRGRLKGVDFQIAYGSFQKSLVTVSSHHRDPVSHEFIKGTTITFSRVLLPRTDP